MARAKRLLRVEAEIDYFGFVMLEFKESGIRIVSREKPGVVHAFTWDYLRSVCKCDECSEGKQLSAEFL